jgi:hypothetical protein
MGISDGFRRRLAVAASTGRVRRRITKIINVVEPCMRHGALDCRMWIK